MLTTLPDRTRRRGAGPWINQALLDALRPRNCLGATDHTVSQRRINHGSDASLDDMDPQTWMFLGYPTDVATANKRLARKSGTGTMVIDVGNVVQNNAFRYFRARATTGSDVNAAVLVQNVWQWASVIDAGGVTPRIYWARLHHLLAEAGSYIGQTTGVGAPTTDASGNLFVGSRDSVNTQSLWYLAFYTAYRRVLTLDEQRQIQAEPWIQLPNCVLHCFPGLGGAGSRVIDWSGFGNHGTADSAAVPLRTGPRMAFPPRPRTVVQVAAAPPTAGVEYRRFPRGVERGVLRGVSV